MSTKERRVFDPKKLRAWSKQVMLRDGKKCICCGSTEKLHAHHLKRKQLYPRSVYSVNNGVTLCQWCHYDIHALSGYPIQYENHLLARLAHSCPIHDGLAWVKFILIRMNLDEETKFIMLGMQQPEKTFVKFNSRPEFGFLPAYKITLGCGCTHVCPDDMTLRVVLFASLPRATCFKENEEQRCRIIGWCLENLMNKFFIRLDKEEREQWEQQEYWASLDAHPAHDNKSSNCGCRSCCTDECCGGPNRFEDEEDVEREELYG